MTVIKCTVSRQLEIKAEIAEVYGFFSDPDQINSMMTDVQTYERLDADSARWILQGRSEKGVSYQPDYSLVFQGDGRQIVEWRSGEGNLGCAGKVSLTPAGNRTRLDYFERIEPDLDVTSIAAKLLKGIVQREIRSDVDRFLERVKAHLESPRVEE